MICTSSHHDQVVKRPWSSIPTGVSLKLCAGRVLGDLKCSAEPSLKLKLPPRVLKAIKKAAMFGLLLV